MRREFHIGPGATSLILVAVVLCMGALGILSMVNSRNDVRLAERSIVMAEGVSTLYDRSERSLAALDAAVAAWQRSGAEVSAMASQLPEGMTLQDGVVRWQETTELGQTLWCAAQLQEAGTLPRVTWKEHYIMTEAGLDGLDDTRWN